MGVKPVPNKFVHSLVESHGFSYESSFNLDTAILYKSGEDVYHLSEDVFETESGEIYAKVMPLDVGAYGQLQESNPDIDNMVLLGEDEYQASDEMTIVDDEHYVLLTPLMDEDEGLEVLTVEGVDFDIVDEEDADFCAYLTEDEEGDFTLVGEDDEYDYSVFVSVREED